ncbi:YceI family protein [Paraferrimonas sedimenticola]|uniref:Lipid/polyisoprenoid-binding YceI-like domain-containing protein n=1 Tax=Paraferrimonas sedimenticola TaxID=375674 RepID=A0AA37RXJ8_9GAMM|nr:YceI family protein [Paraferrimonas sedimenticola]GLP96452.1 hypothetical protein GCM10007895_17580 [Paraferrimonas sedimenticola]
MGKNLSSVNRILLMIVLVLLALSLSLQVQAAPWQIDNTGSRVNFISIKKNTVAENHHFKKISGRLAESGEFDLAIDLSSVDTLIDIRNQRMIEYLFETTKFATANLSAKVDVAQVNNLAVGDDVSMRMDAKISLHGEDQVMPVTVRVAKLSANKILVTSEQPLLLNADTFAMTAGVEKLRELAGLASISPAVPVSFVLLLTQG